MFTINAEGFTFGVEFVHNLPEPNYDTPKAFFRSIERLERMGKKQFRKHDYGTDCFIYPEDHFGDTDHLESYGRARLGYGDRLIASKTAGSRIAFGRAIAKFPRDVRKLFWQQYFAEEQTWSD